MHLRASFVVQATSYSQAALPTHRARAAEEGQAVLGLPGAFREAGWSQHYPCLTPVLEAAWEQGAFPFISHSSLQPNLLEVSTGDIKYQLATWSSWGTSRCLAFVGALTSSGGEPKARSVSTTSATSSCVEVLEFSAQGRGSIPACLWKRTGERHVPEGVCSCGAPLWGQGLSHLSHSLVLHCCFIEQTIRIRLLRAQCPNSHLYLD